MPLLITADDAGASIEVNEAIRRSIVEGHVNSVAFLVNLPATEDAFDRVGPRIGHRSVHLNFVEGRPLALESDSPLLDSEGWFKYQASQLLVTYYRGSKAKRARIAADIRRESVAQLEVFFRQFPGPLAIDSHQHTHMLPFALPPIIAAATDLDVPVSRLRWPVEKVRISESLSGGGIKALALRAMATSGRKHVRESVVEGTSRAFCGVVHTGHMTLPVVQRFLRHIDGLSPEESAEVLLHPGGGQTVTDAWARSPALRDFYTSPWRDSELLLARDPALSYAHG